MRNIFLMPLRKGSKGIVGKNTRLLYGKPLFSWYIETIIKSKLSDEIWIATDCEKVREIVNDKYSSVSIFNRSRQNAKDSSPTIDVVLEFLHQNHFHKDDNLILVQATSPLTSVLDIQHLFEQIKKEQFDSILACLRMKRFRWNEDGQPLDYELTRKPRRQDYKGFLIETGSFYCSKVGDILHSKQLISGKIGVVEVGQQAMIDIDEPIDLVLGEAYLSFLENNV